MIRINRWATVRGPRLLRTALVLMGLMWQVPGVCQEGKVAPAAGKSSPEALTMYADAANYQNNGAYELAAEEWSRFVARFGEDPLAAKAQHYRGVCLQQLKQYAEAAKAYTRGDFQASGVRVTGGYLSEPWLVPVLAGRGWRTGAIRPGGRDVHQVAVGKSGWKVR